MNTGTRETLDRKIQEHLDDILLLGNMVVKAILGAVDALKERDLKAARHIYNEDKNINERRFDIERRTLITVATQQPMARDLRILASVLDVSGELERIGDYAKGIARITIMLGDEAPLKPLIDVPKMAQITVDMLQRALEAFVESDAETAQSIPQEDDKVDELYNLVYQELLQFMIKDQSTVDKATFLLWVAHNLERAADRVTNICERTIFTATGRLAEINNSDDEVREF
ncbi:MAG: phosphate transport system regulatory protein PhoU [Anaerolineaceae bacterium 4572_5.1]|nr:MAG: phosphate transport system regulatory protein PhoU [Anaerolinea sp. 4484_236]OQY30504.1 MAG: phosphate transport system regulatory protein PhoU [Anaerolineaceae bacterium 4572_5.1]RLD08168.1 MAG: phosphate transport system regulatory protein PhoU [Chloroflexota bacterium]